MSDKKYRVGTRVRATRKNVPYLKQVFKDFKTEDAANKEVDRLQKKGEPWICLQDLKSKTNVLLYKASGANVYTKKQSYL